MKALAWDSGPNLGQGYGMGGTGQGGVNRDRGDEAPTVLPGWVERWVDRERRKGRDW